MTKPAAIQGDYSDLRFVKGRKVAQIVIEIPIEEAGSFVETFGTPCPDKSVPVAIARLNPGHEQLKQDLKDSVAIEEKKGGRLARRAGIMCQEPAFWKFLQERHDVPVPISSAEDAADFIRMECQVLSRAELDHHPSAADRFHDIDREYTAWCSA